METINQQNLEELSAGVVDAGYHLHREDQLVVELKSVENLSPVHHKQLLTYLRLMKLPLGLLMNFGAATCKEGLKRIVNGHRNFAASRLRVNQYLAE